MFRSEFQHSLDSKGRFTVPAKLREQLGEVFIATKGFEGCVFLYPMKEWQAVEEKLSSLPFTNSKARAVMRFFFSSACECEMDKQGRVLLPANLREHAGIQREIVIIGVRERLEVWSREKWEKYYAECAESIEDMAEDLDGLGFK